MFELMGKIKVFSLIWMLELASHQSKPIGIMIKPSGLSLITPLNGLWVDFMGFLKSIGFSSLLRQNYPKFQKFPKQIGLVLSRAFIKLLETILWSRQISS